MDLSGPKITRRKAHEEPEIKPEKEQAPGPVKDRKPARKRDREPAPDEGRKPALEVEQEIDPEQVLETMMQGIQVSDLIPDRGRQGLSKSELETLRIGLQPDILGPAILEARKVEIRSKPRELLHENGTLAQYQQVVDRLRNASRHGDPFHQFSMLTKNEAWSSGAARQQAKSALNREASGHLTELLPGYLRHVRDTVSKQNKDPAEADQARNELGAVYYTDAFERLSGRRIDIDQLLNLASSAIYYAEFQPDIHGLRIAKQNAERARETGITTPTPQKARSETGNEDGFEGLKHAHGRQSERRTRKGVLSKINEFESRMRREINPDFDWRSAFWAAVETDHKLSTDRKAALAVLMSTGCRPVALASGKGVDVHFMRPKDTDNDYRLVIRVPNSKGSDPGYLGQEVSDTLRQTNVDKTEIEELKKNEQVINFNTKGQKYVYFEIHASAPEALWLAQYVKDQGLDPEEWSRDFDDDELEAFGKYDRKIKKSITINWTHAFKNPDEANHLKPGERTKLLGKSLDKQVKRIAKASLPGIVGMSPYIFRHSISADVKQQSKDRALRSAVLGHSSSRTSRAYGATRQGRKDFRNRGRQITGQQTHRQVRKPSKGASPAFKK